MGGSPVSYSDPYGLWRLPDYATVQLDLYVFNVSATLNKYGDVYLGKGLSRPYPNPVSGGVSISNGWMLSCSPDGPTRKQLNDFIDGFSQWGGGYFGIGGSYSRNSSGSAINFGVGFGGVAVTPGSVNSSRGNIFGERQ